MLGKPRSVVPSAGSVARILPALFLLAVLPAAAETPPEQYVRSPDSERQEGVPQGRITRHEHRSEIFAETIRRYYLYVPAQYDDSTPAAIMVFQDGYGYVTGTDFRVAIVFDNLIHQKKMPVTIGIFVNPGILADHLDAEHPWGVPEGAKSNRTEEYDTLSPKYADFLEEEILAEVGKRYKLSRDPEMRAICGMSSGGICAFTVAWERPDLFRKVMSYIGSFTNVRGGHVYPALIRKTDRKPLRIFLQGGENDLDNVHGNWWLSNLQMEKALAFKQYDLKTAWGTGGHNGTHGGAIFPETLIWLWRDWTDGAEQL